MTMPLRTPTPGPITEPAERRPEALEGPISLPRRRGAPLGNQNARRNLYLDHENLTEAFLAARETRGLTDEIAWMRIRVKLLLSRNAPNAELFPALELLNRLLLTHNKLIPPEGDPAY